MNHDDPKPMACSKRNSKREVHSNTVLPQVTGKSQMNDWNLHLKQPGKEEQTKPEVKRKEIIQIRTEINEIETKKAIANINETKSWFFEKINKIDKPLARFIKEKRRKDSKQ